MSEGPFTDEIAREMVADGLLEEVGPNDDGEMRYRLTPAGMARAEAFIHGTLEGAELWAALGRTDRRADP